MARAQDKRSLEEWRKKVKLLREQTHINPHETKQDQEARVERAKKDYEYFVSFYLPTFATTKTPDFHISTARRIKRNHKHYEWLKWGRGLAKSVLADVTVPLWLWINNEISFMLLIGQEKDKAAVLLDDLRLQFEANQRLIHDFGVQKNLGYWETGFFITKSGFIAKSIGMGQEPRGLRVGGTRPDYIVCDDWETKDTLKNHKRQDEFADWLLKGIIPTMDGDRERVLLAQNHFAPRMIFSKIVEENKGWRINQQGAFDPVTLLPVWKEKYPENYYRDRIGVMGSIEANAEYNNDPHIEGKIFTDDMIQWANLPRLNSFEAIIGTWDVAFAGSSTSDYNAVRVWGLHEGKKYLIDCFVRRSKIKAPLEWIAEFQKNLPKTVSVPFQFEAQFWNDEIYRTIGEVEKEYGFMLVLSKSERPRMKKYDRILEMHPQYQNGRIYYNAKLKDHNDTKQGLIQLKGIEPGYKGHDDAPDADKEAFDYLDNFDSHTNHRYVISKRESRHY